MKLAEFPKKTDLQIANDFIEILNTIKIKEPTTQMPYDLVAFRNMQEGQEKNAIRKDEKKTFWTQKSIVDYLKDVSQCESDNQSNMYWLYWTYDHIGESKPESLVRKIIEFEEYMKANKQFKGDVTCRFLYMKLKNTQQQEVEWDD